MTFCGWFGACQTGDFRQDVINNNAFCLSSSIRERTYAKTLNHYHAFLLCRDPFVSHDFLFRQILPRKIALYRSQSTTLV